MRDRQMKSEYLQANKLKDFGRVFKDFLVSSLPGEMIQFDSYFSDVSKIVK